MEIVNKTKHIYTVRLDSGEEFITAVQNFCTQHGVTSGWLEALGSSRELQLAYFNTEKKEYETKDFQEFLEITTITGNIALKDGKPFCHAHGMFSRADMSVVGGHVMRCVVSATCEIKIEVARGTMQRKFDDRTGLHLLDGSL